MSGLTANAGSDFDVRRSLELGGEDDGRLVVLHTARQKSGRPVHSPARGL